MNNVWIFGCSFSSGHLEVPREKTYGNLLGNDIGYNVKNMASAGNSNDKIFYDLIKNLNEINKNDIVIYQFSNFNRIGFFKNQYEYFSSAGIPELGVKHKIKENSFDGITENEAEVLLDYILSWQIKRKKFDLDSPINLLEYLQNEKKIKYFLLFMNNDVDKRPKNTILLPVERYDDNISMELFFIMNKLTLSDDFPQNHKDFFDSHPGLSGHLAIKNTILNNLNKRLI